MRRVITFALLCAYWGSLPAAASAQTLQMPLTRGDASASIGWFGADRRLSGECCSGWSAGLFKGIAGGYYWTDNLKTEVELGWPGETEAYSYTSTPLPGSLSAFQYDEHTFTGLKLSAAQQYQRVVQLDPYTATNHYYLGLMNHLLNRLQEAAANYLTAIKLNPNDMKSNMYLALVHTALGRPEVGLPYARRAVELDPHSAEAAANLAVVLDANGDFAGAEAGYRRALELDPNSPETVVNLAGALMSQKRYKDAVTAYEQALKIQDTPLVRVRYGYALLNSGRVDDAIAQFKNVAEQNPRNYQALNGLGDATIAQYKAGAGLDEKKRSDAVGYWKRSLDINPQQNRIAGLVTQYSKGGLIQ